MSSCDFVVNVDSFASCTAFQGMASEITGPTLPDLKDRLGVNYELISWALVSKSLGK